MKAQVSIETLLIVSLTVTLFLLVTGSVHYRSRMVDEEEVSVEAERVCNELVQRIAFTSLQPGFRVNHEIPSGLLGEPYNFTINLSEGELVWGADSFFCSLPVPVNGSAFNLSNTFLLKNVNGGVVVE